THALPVPRRASYGWRPHQTAGRRRPRLSESLLPLFNRGDAATSSASTGFGLLASSASSSSLSANSSATAAVASSTGDHLAGAAAGNAGEADDPSSGASLSGWFGSSSLLSGAAERDPLLRCLGLSRKQRVLAFVTLLLLGSLFLSLSLVFLPWCCSRPPVCRAVLHGLALPAAVILRPVGPGESPAPPGHRAQAAVHLRLPADAGRHSLFRHGACAPDLWLCFSSPAWTTLWPGSAPANAVQVRLWLENTENDLNQGDDHRFSLLHWAAWDGQTGIADLLLSRGARVNATNMGDDTPFAHRRLSRPPRARLMSTATRALHYACFFNHEETAVELVNQGGLVSLENRYGQTPLDLARPALVRQLRHLARELGQEVEMRQPHNTSDPLGAQTWRTRPTNPTLSRQPGIQYEQLNLRSRLAGRHGTELWRGTWQDQDIAAARLRREFKRAAAQTAHLQQHQRAAVLSAVISDQRLGAGFMPYGSLFDVLHSGHDIIIDANKAMGFALDIAKGMDFLTKLEQPLHHFQLNSKHVMVDEDLTARISLADCRFVYTSGRRSTPYWMSPRRCRSRRRTSTPPPPSCGASASCCGSWETREVPFGSLGPMEAGLKIAVEGLRISCTAPGFSKHTSKLIQLATNEEAGRRPRFDMVVPILQKILRKTEA
uniref:ANK_REP_REGION domain-containing protein n=1 Tax=Macrostomum lignano TaxID=282301 RepID=A0A1I8FPP7_9PLAT